jgi:hypothetical protein
LSDLHDGYINLENVSLASQINSAALYILLLYHLHGRYNREVKPLDGRPRRPDAMTHTFFFFLSFYLSKNDICLQPRIQRVTPRQWLHTVGASAALMMLSHRLA